MSKSDKNLYQILELPEDCSSQDIKNSFIRLSKKYHPDKSNDKSHHAAFVEINNAYSVLGKQSSRTFYDSHLSAFKDGKIFHHYYDNVYTTRNDPAFWATRPKGPRDDPYYGIKGVKRVPNSVIVGACIFLAAVGIGVEYLIFSRSMQYTKEKMRVESAKSHILWELARERAHTIGNEEQIRNIQDGTFESGNMKQAEEIYKRRLVESEADLSNK